MRWPYTHARLFSTKPYITARLPDQVAGPGCRTFWFRCKVQAQTDKTNTGKTPLSVRSPLPDSSRTAPSRNRVHYCAPPSQASGKVRLFLPAHDMRSAERSKSRVVGAECRVVGGSIRRGTGSRDWCFRVSEEPRTPNFLECLFFSLLLTATNIYGVVCYCETNPELDNVYMYC